METLMTRKELAQGICEALAEQIMVMSPNEIVSIGKFCGYKLRVNGNKFSAIVCKFKVGESAMWKKVFVKILSVSDSLKYRVVDNNYNLYDVAENELEKL